MPSERSRSRKDGGCRVDASRSKTDEYSMPLAKNRKPVTHAACRDAQSVVVPDVVVMEATAPQFSTNIDPVRSVRAGSSGVDRAWDRSPSPGQADATESVYADVLHRTPSPLHTPSVDHSARSIASVDRPAEPEPPLSLEDVPAPTVSEPNLPAPRTPTPRLRSRGSSDVSPPMADDIRQHTERLTSSLQEAITPTPGDCPSIPPQTLSAARRCEGRRRVMRVAHKSCWLMLLALVPPCPLMPLACRHSPHDRLPPCSGDGRALPVPLKHGTPPWICPARLQHKPRQ